MGGVVAGLVLVAALLVVAVRVVVSHVRFVAGEGRYRRERQRRWDELVRRCPQAEVDLAGLDPAKWS